jgi:hypothetical protein
VRILKITGWLTALFLMSFVREYVFEGINDRLFRLFNSQPEYPIYSALTLIAPLSYYPLYYFKYFLILLFTLIFFLLTRNLLRAWFDSDSYNKLCLGFFTGVLALCTLLFGIGIATGYGHQGYSVARHLIELIQSPLAAFMLIAFGHWDSGKIRIKKRRAR